MWLLFYGNYSSSYPQGLNDRIGSIIGLGFMVALTLCYTLLCMGLLLGLSCVSIRLDLGLYKVLVLGSLLDLRVVGFLINTGLLFWFDLVGT